MEGCPSVSIQTDIKIWSLVVSIIIPSWKENLRGLMLRHVGVTLFCLLVAYRPSNKRVYLRDGSAQTILRVATLR